MLIRKKTDNKPSVTERSIELAKRATLKKIQFSPSKSEFKDGLHLIYEWQPPNTPHTCPCGQPFTLTHTLYCPKGGYTHLRHNGVRDTFATLLDEVCHDVEIEPKLQSLEGKSIHNKTTSAEDDARLDIKANGFWGGPFSQKKFRGKNFQPHLLPINIISCQNIKKPTSNSRCGTQQLSSTNFVCPSMVNCKFGCNLLAASKTTPGSPLAVLTMSSTYFSKIHAIPTAHQLLDCLCLHLRQC